MVLKIVVAMAELVLLTVLVVEIVLEIVADVLDACACSVSSGTTSGRGHH